MNDLLEAFDAFLEPPSLEEKIWLKIALDVGIKTLKEALPNQVGRIQFLTYILVGIQFTFTFDNVLRQTNPATSLEIVKKKE